MKYLLLILFSLNAGLAKGQSLGERIKNAAKRTAENKIVQKTSQAVDKSMDKAIDAAASSVKKKEDGPATEDDETNEAVQQPKKDFSKTMQQLPAGADTGITQFGVYQRFTFVPGNKLIFYDDFSKDTPGDFPALWETGGSGEVVTTSTYEGNWLSLQRRSGYMAKMAKELPENYTIEFDLISNGFNSRSRAALFFAFLSKKAYSMGQGGSLADMELRFGDDLTFEKVENFGGEVTVKIGTVIDRHLTDAVNSKVHFSIAVNGERLAIWMDQKKYVDAPSILQANIGKYFILEARDISPDNGQLVAISNFKIAESGEDMRSKLLKDGRISTTGIYFNTNSAYIQKESYGILKSIGDMMIADPKLKLNIVGHTDADGEAVFNQDLSERRAETIKKTLEKEFGIDPNRLTFSGKGESEPADTNDTATGRANNRRVEFVKR